jgi:nicotinamidase/pyrazinamidase
MADAERIAELIKAKRMEISEITITLDSHHKMHIAHGVSWVNDKGEHPAPFTIISEADAANEVWKASDKSRTDKFKRYAKDLEKKGRFQICIWPEHCLIGTHGHSVIQIINEAVQDWCGANTKTAEYIWKGENLDTEMYSAIAAEVPVANDPSTQFNETLMQRLSDCDVVIMCGQALSHCVNFTVRDIIARWKGSKSALIVLTDCSSAVPGFEKSAQEFVQFCKDHEVQVTTSKELLKEWDQRCLPRPRVEHSTGIFGYLLSWLPVQVPFLA